MARNKYPEETIERILQVAMKLFFEKGYEHTSINDITNQLEGLTKGAIYHHFKSKDEILLKVGEKMSQPLEISLSKLLSDETLNGREKIKGIFNNAIMSKGNNEFLTLIPNLLDNPAILAMNIKNIQDELVPLYVQPMIKQGMEDGSITTDKPKEVAELLLVCFNIWINPLVFVMTPEEIKNKLQLIQIIFKPFKLDFVDDELIQYVSQLNDQRK